MVKKKEKSLREIGYTIPVTANNDSRFVQHDELKYSLRSLYKFAPWVRNVYIVTDNQVPEWFNTKNEWARIIDHTDIFNDLSVLPTYNSNAIETRIHHIPGLSEHFLYFNDDLYLGRSCTSNDFFTKNGRPYVYVVKKNTFMSKRRRIELDKKKKTKNEFEAGLVTSRELVYSNYGRLCKADLVHGIRVYHKGTMNKLESIFQSLFKETAGNSFRTSHDILSFAILGYYLLVSKKGKPRLLPQFRSWRYIINNLLCIVSSFVFFYIGIEKNNYREKLAKVTKYKVFHFCINDRPGISQSRYQYIRDYLQEKYPVKSPAEL